MALTVEDMSRMTSYVMSGSPMEKFIKDSEIPPEDVAETKRYWTGIKNEYDSMKPGESMLVPNEWS